MLDKNQVENLDSFANQVITAYEKNGKYVTLTRADGTRFTFTVSGVDGSEGTKGDKGDTGDRGISAYESYKNANRTTANSETEWIYSLKGETGDKGAPGRNGVKGDTGATGITPTFEVGTITTLSPGSTPTASLEKNGNTYKINVGIPKGGVGLSGADGTTPSLYMGTVTTIANNGTPTISVTKDGNNYYLNLGIPRGPTGTTGEVTAGGNGTEPTVNFNVSMGTVTSVSKSVSGNTWTISLTIPTGAKGDTGDVGPSGNDGNSIMSAVPIYVSTTSSDADVVNKPNPASFNGGSSNNGAFFGIIGKDMINNKTGFGMNISWGSTYYYAAMQWVVLGLSGTDDASIDHLSRAVINNNNYFNGLWNSQTISHGWFYT